MRTTPTPAFTRHLHRDLWLRHHAAGRDTVSCEPRRFSEASSCAPYPGLQHTADALLRARAERDTPRADWKQS